MAYFLLKEEEGIRSIASCLLLDPSEFRSLHHPIKLKILKHLSSTPAFVGDLANELKLHEQNIYYHMKGLEPYLEVVDEKKIRGTIAKKYALKSSAFCLSFSQQFLPFLEQKQHTLHPFFAPFIKDGVLSAKFVVGSPDQHGTYKARARDGHYATDLSFFLGQHGTLSPSFSVSLDVDISLKDTKENLIVVGGPVTNVVMDEVNKQLPTSFTQDKPWGIKGKRDTYTDDSCGLIARIPHPHYPEYSILAVAGVRFSGTKAAVIGLTRFTSLILQRFTHQKTFCAVIQGFDLDGDGKIDSVELLE